LLVAVVVICILCLDADSPGRDPSVLSTSSHRSQSAMGSSESGHKALVLKVQSINYVVAYSASCTGARADL